MPIFNLFLIFFHLKACASLAIEPRHIAKLSPLNQSQMVPFYRTPTSAFASGQIPLIQLIKTQKKTEFQDNITVLWNAKQYQVRSQDLMTDQDLITNNQLSKANVLEKDLGKILNIIDTYLRTGPSYESSIITTVPQRHKMTPLLIDGSWIQVKYKSQIGYIDLNHCIGRADFAQMILTDHWQEAKYRSGEFVVTNENKKIPISEIKDYLPHPNKAVYISEKINQPLLNSDVLIIKKDQTPWMTSLLPDHGQIYWQMKDEYQSSNKLIQRLTTEDILKGEVFSFSVDQRNQKNAIVAKNGIFTTTDGTNWQNIQMFKNQNYPVLIHDRLWFVGPYLSTNQGQSFTSYLRWDKITELIQNTKNLAPKKIEIKNITITKKNKISLLIDAGNISVQLTGIPHTNQWSVH